MLIISKINIQLNIYYTAKNTVRKLSKYKDLKQGIKMFAQAMTANNTYTWNGALSNSKPDNQDNLTGRISLFFKAIRGCQDEQLVEYLKTSASENLIDTIILAFNIRDCRGGKGERDIGRKLLAWIANKYPDKFESILHLVPEYGRWDDLLHLIPEVPQITRISILDLYKNQLKSDTENMIFGKSVSLCAKWCPTEGSALDKKGNIVDMLCKHMGIKKRQYRKKISPLRWYLNVVERFMCTGKWSHINFSEVPSCAIKRLKKAFEKNASIEYNTWKSKLQKGKVQVKGKQLFPYEIIREIRQTRALDPVTAAQWDVLVKTARELGVLQKTLVMVDTSGSMELNNSLPLDIATSLGLLVSEIVEGEFHNHVLTFSERPSFFVLNDDTLQNRYYSLRSANWGMSTNIHAAFDLILNKAVAAGLNQEHMPEKLLIISDMQFDQAKGHNTITNYNSIKNTYTKAGYKLPQIVFWNVNGSSTDFPVTVADDGTCMISGASPSILKQIMESHEFSSEGILMDVVRSDRYQPIRNILENKA